MLPLFEQDKLFIFKDKPLLEQEIVKQEQSSFQYPLYQPQATTVLLLQYPALTGQWLPPAHKELLETIISKGFNYTLEEVAVFNVEEVKTLKENQIHFPILPKVVFYLDNRPMKSIEEWVAEKKCLFYVIPTLAEMLKNEQAKRTAWTIIKNYKTNHT